MGVRAAAVMRDTACWKMRSLWAKTWENFFIQKKVKAVFLVPFLRLEK